MLLDLSLPRLPGPSPLVIAALRDRSPSPAAARLRDSIKRATAAMWGQR